MFFLCLCFAVGFSISVCLFALCVSVCLSLPPPSPHTPSFSLSLISLSLWIPIWISMPRHFSHTTELFYFPLIYHNLVYHFFAKENTGREPWAALFCVLIRVLHWSATYCLIYIVHVSIRLENVYESENKIKRGSVAWNIMCMVTPTRPHKYIQEGHETCLRIDKTKQVRLRDFIIA